MDDQINNPTTRSVRREYADAVAFSALPEAPTLPASEPSALRRAWRQMTTRRSAARSIVAARPGHARPRAPRLPASGPLCG
jgi:hypothetical protein